MTSHTFADVFFFSSRRRHTRYIGDWSSDVCSSDLGGGRAGFVRILGFLFSGRFAPARSRFGRRFARELANQLARAVEKLDRHLIFGFFLEGIVGNRAGSWILDRKSVV